MCRLLGSTASSRAAAAQLWWWRLSASCSSWRWQASVACFSVCAGSDGGGRAHATERELVTSDWLPEESPYFDVVVRDGRARVVLEDDSPCPEP